MTTTLRPGSRVTITSTYSTTAHLNGTAATVLEVSARTYRVRPDGWPDRLSQWLPHAEVAPLPCPVCDRDHATTRDPMGALVDCLRRAVAVAAPEIEAVAYRAPAGPRPAVCPNDLADDEWDASARLRRAGWEA